MKTNWWKKSISILLTAVIVMTTQPFVNGSLTVQATAASEEIPVQTIETVEVTNKTLEMESVAPEVISIDPVIQVNPLYEDVVEESDLKILSDDSAATLTDTIEYGDQETAAEVIREGMKNRVESFVVYYQCEEAYEEAIPKGLVDYALTHTKEATEGDYLRWQYGGYSIAGSYSEANGVYYYTFTYTFTYYTTAEQEEEVDAAVSALLTELNLGEATDYQKISSIYDYICGNVDYDYDNLENDDYKLKYTAYAALVNKTAVCQGYAVLFYRLALELGLDVRVISGISSEQNHGWNIVKLGEVYFNVDCTWDASLLEGMDYAYFLRCDDNFADHTRDDEYTTDAFYDAYPMSSSDYVLEGDLVFRSEFQWDEENGLFIEETASWSDVDEVFQAEIPGSLVQIAFRTENGTGEYQYQPISSDELTASEGISIEVRPEDDTWLSLESDTVSTGGKIYYQVGDQTFELLVDFIYPEFGFYSDEAHTDQVFEKCFYDDKIYVYIPAERQELGESESITLGTVTADGEDIEWTSVSDGLFAVDCSSFGGDFYLEAEWGIAGTDGFTLKGIYGVDCAKTGLVLAWPEWEDGEPQITDTLDWRGSLGGSIGTGHIVALGTRDTSGNVEPLEIGVDDTSLSIAFTGMTGQEISVSPWVKDDSESTTTSFVHLCIPEEGMYKVSRAGDTAKVYAELPRVGWYTSDEANVDHFIYEDSYGYTNKQREFYLIYDRTSGNRTAGTPAWTVNDSSDVDGYVTLVSTEGTTENIWKISVNEGMTEDFDLRVTVPYVNSEDAGDIENEEVNIRVCDEEADGLVFTYSLHWTDTEEAGTVIDGIWLQDDTYIEIDSKDELEKYIADGDIRTWKDGLGFEVPEGNAALFFQDYDEETETYSYTLLNDLEELVLGDDSLIRLEVRDNYYLELGASEPSAEGVTLSYTKDGVTYEIPVQAYWPEVGIYNDTARSEETMLSDGIQFNNDQRSFYLRLDPWDKSYELALDSETPYEVLVDEVSVDADSYIESLKPVTGEAQEAGLYELILTESCPESFDLKLNIVVTESDGSSRDMQWQTWLEKKPSSGLVFAWDLKWDEDGLPIGIFQAGRENDDQYFGKEDWETAVNDGEIEHNWIRDGVPFFNIPESWIVPFFAEYRMEDGEEESYDYVVVSPDDIEITAEDGADISWEVKGDYIRLTSDVGGIYTLKYTAENGKTYTQDVELGIPAIAFYRENCSEYEDPSLIAEALLNEWQFEYNSQEREFYLIYEDVREDRYALDPVWIINGEEALTEEDGAYAYNISIGGTDYARAQYLTDASGCVWQITVAEGMEEDFELRVKVPFVNNEDENEVLEEPEVGLWLCRGRGEGLVFCADLVWDDEGNIVGWNEGADWSLDGQLYFAEIPEGYFELAYCSWDEENQDWNYELLGEDAEVTLENEDGSSLQLSVKENNGDDEHTYWCLKADTFGKGVITAQTGSIPVEMAYPVGGFYRDSECLELITDVFRYDSADEIYAKLDSSREGDQRIRLQSVQIDGEEISLDDMTIQEDSVNIYYTIPCSLFNGDFELSIRYECYDPTTDEVHWEDCRSIRCESNGLAVSWPEWWDDEPHVRDDDWQGSVSMNITNSTLLALGIRSEDGVETVHGGKVTITDMEGHNVSGVTAFGWRKDEESAYGEFFEFCIPYSGDYILTYTNTDENDEEYSYSICISAGLPEIGFYSAPSRSDVTYYMDGEYTWKSGSLINSYKPGLYMIAAKNESLQMQNLKLEVEGGLDASGYLEITESEDESFVIWNLSVLPEAMREFQLRAKADFYRTEGEESWHEYEADSWIRVYNEKESDRESYEDGEPYAGYKASFISEQEYISGNLNPDYGAPLYWVHAATIDEVLEKLTALAGQEVADGAFVIENTGYVHISTSCSQEYTDNLSEEAVIPPKSIKGIQLGVDTDTYHVMIPDTDGNWRTDISAPVYYAEDEITFLGVNLSPWIPVGSTYACVEGEWYFCSYDEENDRFVIAVDEEENPCKVEGGNIVVNGILSLALPEAENIRDTTYQNPDFPKLYLSGTTDYTIMGPNVPDPTIGFYKESGQTVVIRDMMCVESPTGEEETGGWIFDTSSDTGAYRFVWDTEDGQAESVITITRMQEPVVSIAGDASGANVASDEWKDQLEIPDGLKKPVISGDEWAITLHVNKTSTSNIGSAAVRTIDTKAGYLLGRTYYDVQMVMESGDIAYRLPSVSEGTVSLSLDVPSSYSSARGTVKVVRYANGSAELMDAVISDGKAVFETDKLSTSSKPVTYAVVWISNLKYRVTSSSDLTVAVTGTTSSGESLVIPSAVYYNGKSYKVTSVYANAFKGNKTLKNITIGGYVTSIGNTAFYGCTALTKISIPLRVTSIGVNAFKGCTSMTSATIGKGVTTIGNTAFYGCTALKTLSFASGSALTSIGTNAFKGCSVLAKVILPSKVTSIGNNAFQNCKGMTALTMDSAVSKIGSNAFYGCTNLKTITIKTTQLTSSNVGSNAFKGIYTTAVIKVPSSKLSDYKEILTAKGASANVRYVKL